MLNQFPFPILCGLGLGHSDLKFDTVTSRKKVQVQANHKTPGKV